MIGQNFLPHNDLSLSSDGSTRSSDCSQPDPSTSRVIPTTVTKIFIPRNTIVPKSVSPSNSMKDFSFKSAALQPNTSQQMQHKSTVTPVTPPKIQAKIPTLKSPTRIIVPSQTNASGTTLTFITHSTNSSNLTTNVMSSKPSTPTLSSPTKLYIRHPVQGQPIHMAGGKTVLSASSVSGNNLQAVRVPGSKIQYLRLVPPSTTGQHVQSSSTVRPIAPSGPAMIGSGVTASLSGAQSVKITMPVQQLIQKGTMTTATPHSQRFLLPNTHLPIQPSAATSHNLSSIQPGTTIISNRQGMQGYALVPTQIRPQGVDKAPVQIMMSGVRSQTSTTHTLTTPLSSISHSRSDYIPIASSDPTISGEAARTAINGSTIEATGARPRKPCNCTKSQCLKLYCDCFANGEFCHNCNCNNCANNLRHESERSRAIKSCLDRNPMAFHPKIGKGRVGEGDYRRHNKGCNCKRSGCLKNYCECYEAKIMCSNTCKCVGCKNYEESPERKTLMHLADAAEVRVLQQTAAKHKVSTQTQDLPARHSLLPSGERLPYTFVTTDVAEATCACLLAQAEEAEKQNMPHVVQERMVIEEFGRCLLQIIESAHRTKAASPSP